LPILIGSASVAEMLATFFLCPLEVAKLRMQTDVSYRASGLVGTLGRTVRSEGVLALFKGYTPIALRQVPYTSCKLVAFELCAAALISSLSSQLDDNRLQQLRPAIVIVAGMCAGAAAAVVSQPADVLLTRMCGSSAVTNMAECVTADGLIDQVRYMWSLGMREAFSGLGARITMISSMTAVQFLGYDTLRSALGAGSSK